MKNTVVAICLMTGSGLVFAEGPAHWGYEGHGGPANWGSLSQEFATCKLGQLQAPIDIPSKLAIKTTAPIRLGYKASAAEISNNGHTIQIALSNGGSANFSGTDHQILYFHFHTPAEEKIDGKGYPFNAHLVHKSADGKLAVMGVFFEEGKENASLTEVFANLPTKEGTVALKSDFDVGRVLPSSLAYYGYAGSLTTPPCNEGVTFYILKTPVQISSGQLDAFRKIFPVNARPSMPLNGRAVIEGN